MMGKMTSFSGKKGIFFAAAALLALVGCLWFAQKMTVIDITNDTNHTVIYSHGFNPGDRFAFRYVHSVQKTPVWEYYTLNSAGDVVLTGTRVKSLGYGMPKPEQGDSYDFEDDYFVIDNLNQPIRELLIRNTFVRPMQIFCADKVFMLSAVAKQGELIRISGKKATRFEYFLQQIESHWPV